MLSVTCTWPQWPQRALQVIYTRSQRAVQLAEPERAWTGKVDQARIEVVSREVHEPSYRSLPANQARDDQLVQTVLQRRHTAVWRQGIGERTHGVLRGWRLHRQQHALQRI